jgi:hypothetical protein
MKRIPLPRVASELRNRNLTKQPPKYKDVYSAALDARIPAEQDRNGRWSVGDPDLPLIAATLCGDAEAT